MKHLNLFENIFDNVPSNQPITSEEYWTLVLSELKNITNQKEIHLEDLDIDTDEPYVNINFLFSVNNGTYSVMFEQQSANKFVLLFNDYPNSYNQNKVHDINLSSDPKITAAFLSFFIN